MSVKDEALNAGVRVLCGQAVKVGKKLLGKLVSGSKAKKIINNKTTTGLLTTAVGFGAAHLSDNPIVQGIGQEARVLGMATAGNGIADKILKNDEEEKGKDESQPQQPQTT